MNSLTILITYTCIEKVMLITLFILFICGTGDAGRAHVGQVIVVGAEHPRVPEQLGWKNAKSLMKH